MKTEGIMRRMTGKRALRALLGAVVLSGLSINLALASGPNQTPVTVYPSDAQGNRISQPGWWVVTAKPGTTTQLYAVVGDVSNRPAAIRVLAVDATDAMFGGLAYNLPSARVHSVGRWIHLPTGNVSLTGGQGGVMPFKVVIPKGIKPGQYVGGVSAYVPSHDRQTSGKAQVIIQPRVITAVVINVPGPKFFRLGVKNVQAQWMSGAFYIVPHLFNNGNQLLKGNGFMWVYAPGHSKPIVAKAMPIDTTIPGQTFAYPLRWSSHPAKGTYHWLIKLHWNGGSTSKSGTFVIR